MEIVDNKILEQEAYKLLEDIYKFKAKYAKDLSLIDTIIEYSFKYEIPLQDIGETMSNHEDFMKIFNRYLEEEGYIRTNKVTDSLNYEEW